MPVTTFDRVAGPRARGTSGDRLARITILVALVATLGACGAAAPAPSAGPGGGSTASDAAFVLHMLPHHDRAIAVGALAATRGGDPRVREFGRRIVSEQTPERRRLASWVGELGLVPGPGDAGAADGYIDDPTVQRLRTEPLPAFDRDVLLASASSETGAASMARAELDGGRFGPARDLATSIATAPQGEIPELRALAAALP